jgi:hypothetical protein
LEIKNNTIFQYYIKTLRIIELEIKIVVIEYTIQCLTTCYLIKFYVSIGKDLFIIVNKYIYLFIESKFDFALAVSYYDKGALIQKRLRTTVINRCLEF